MRRIEINTGDTQPLLTGYFPGVDLSGATVTCTLTDVVSGADPLSAQSHAATVTQADAAGTSVAYELPQPLASAGEYLGRFTAVKSGETYTSLPFVVQVWTHSRAPVADSWPVTYGDGRGGYATIQDVVQLDMRAGAKTSRISPALLETLLADTAFELDMALDRLYATPITSSQPKSWRYLRIINKYWALAGLLDLLAAGGSADEQFAAASVYRDKGTQMLDDLIEGSAFLTDAIAKSEKPIYPESAGAAIPDELDVEANGTPPIFSVESFRRAGRLE